MVSFYKLMRGDKMLVEIRTDGHVYQVIGGPADAINSIGKGDWDLLRHKIDRSSYLSLQPKLHDVPGLIEHMLHNRDKVISTSDGKTHLFNGRLLSDREVSNLKAGIDNGSVRVKSSNPVT